MKLWTDDDDRRQTTDAGPLVSNKLPYEPLGELINWLTNGTIWRTNATNCITIGTNDITNGTIGKTLNDNGTPLVPLGNPERTLDSKVTKRESPIRT